MTLARAIERKQWDLAALLLLVGVMEAASRLPPRSLAELLDLVAGLPEEEARHGGA